MGGATAAAEDVAGGSGVAFRRPTRVDVVGSLSLSLLSSVSLREPNKCKP